MSWWLWLAVGAVLCLDLAVARADQCAWIDPAIAQRALAIVRQHPTLVTLCEPCGETTPGAPEAVTDARIDAQPDEAAEGLQSLYVGGEEIDLAYAFVEIAPGSYANLAGLAGCPASGVSSALHVSGAPPAAPVPEPPAAPAVLADRPACVAPAPPPARPPLEPGGAIWAELGAVIVRVMPPASITPATATRATGGIAAGPEAIVASGFQFSPWLVGWGGTFFVGVHGEIARFRGARLIDPRSGAPVTSGWISEGALVLGVHRAVGPVTARLELDPGFRTFDTRIRGGTDEGPPLADELALEARAQVDAWLTPHLSLGLGGSIDLVDPRDVGAAVMLGLHIIPRDSLR